MSRGGLIASEIAWRIQRQGYARDAASVGLTSPFGLSVRFLGLYDPVDQTETVDETRSIPQIVDFSAVARATNFAGNDPQEISRWYWDRISYAGADVTATFAATHSGFQGAPTYSTDAGSNYGTVGPGPRNHPSAWLEGYTDALDVQGSIEVDTWFRTQARSVFVPIEFVDDYHLDCLRPATFNDESPNYEIWYGDCE